MRDQGWNRARRLLRYVLPVFGASLSDAVISAMASAQSDDGTWSNPPTVPNDIRSLYGFQVPQQGHAETLRRLGPPADVTAHFRSKTFTFFIEALAFLLVVAAGLFGLKWSLSRKAAFIVLAGVLGMLALGLLSPANSLIAIAWIRAVCCVVALWIFFAVGPVLGALHQWFKRKPRPPQSPPSPPPSSPAPRGPAMPSAPPMPQPSAPPQGGTMTGSSSPVEIIEIPEVKDEDGKPQT